MIRKTSILLLVWSILSSSLPVTANFVSGQGRIQVYPGKSLSATPDGYYHLNWVGDGLLAFDSVMMDFQKKGDSIEGSGLYMIFSVGGIYAPSKFCLKGRVANSEITLTRSILFSPEYKSFLEDVAYITIPQGALLRPLSSQELSEIPDYGTCQNAHSLLDPFEEILSEADNLLPALDSAKYVAKNMKEVRLLYREQIKKASEEILDDVLKGKLTPSQAKEKAYQTRNQIRATIQLRDTNMGRGIAQFMEEHKTLSQIEDEKALARYNRPYSKLLYQEKIWVAWDVVESAAKSRAAIDIIVRNLGRAGTVLGIIGVAIVLAQIIFGDPSFSEVLEGLVGLVVGEAGAAAGDAFAGIICLTGGITLAVCGGILVLAGAIAAVMLFKQGIKLADEWFAKSSGFYNGFVFWQDEARDR